MSSNKAIVGAIISLFLPGLGLLLSKNYKMKGVLIFILAIIADIVSVFVGAVLTLCLIGLVLFAVPPVIHILAAVYTHDKMVVEEKSGKPIVFK